MIAETLRFIFRGFPAVMLILALLIAAVSRRRAPPERFLSWVLLLPIGLSGLWAAAFYVFLSRLRRYLAQRLMRVNLSLTAACAREWVRIMVHYSVRRIAPYRTHIRVYDIILLELGRF